MGDLLKPTFGGPGPPPLTKRHLAAHLGKSHRWIEYQLAAGMPSTLDRRGRRRFVLAEVEDWLAQR